MEPVAGATTDDPVDRLIIQLRAYVAGRPRASGRRSERAWTSGIAVIFDTETTTEPSQRLRFGSYQIRDRGELLERGLFHADDAPAEDLANVPAAFAALEPTEAGEQLTMLIRAAFIER